MEYKTYLCWNTTKLLGFIFTTYALKAGVTFSQYFTPSYEKLYYLNVKKITIWKKFLLLLDGIFPEFFGTNFNPQFLR